MKLIRSLAFRNPVNPFRVTNLFRFLGKCRILAIVRVSGGLSRAEVHFLRVIVVLPFTRIPTSVPMSCVRETTCFLFIHRVHLSVGWNSYSWDL